MNSDAAAIRPFIQQAPGKCKCSFMGNEELKATVRYMTVKPESEALIDFSGSQALALSDVCVAFLVVLK